MPSTTAPARSVAETSVSVPDVGGALADVDVPLAQRRGRVVRVAYLVEFEVFDEEAFTAGFAEFDEDFDISADDPHGVVAAAMERVHVQEYPGAVLVSESTNGEQLRAEQGDELLDWGPARFHAGFYGGLSRTSGN